MRNDIKIGMADTHSDDFARISIDVESKFPRSQDEAL